MTDPDPNDTPIITMPYAGEGAHATVSPLRPAPTEPPPPRTPAPVEERVRAEGEERVRVEDHGRAEERGRTEQPTRVEAPARAEEPRVPPPAPPTSTVLPRTPPPIPNPPSGSSVPRPRPGPGAAPTGSRWRIIHPHVSFFGWLADQQGPADASPEERLQRYRAQSPWLFRTCVVLDLLVLFVVTGILVVALGAALFKAIFGVL